VFLCCGLVRKENHKQEELNESEGLVVGFLFMGIKGVGGAG